MLSFPPGGNLQFGQGLKIAADAYKWSGSSNEMMTRPRDDAHGKPELK